jgi:Glycoside hydrolase family 44
MRFAVALLVAGFALGATPALAAPTLTVDPDAAGSHLISPDIYGMNFADPVLAQQIGLPVDRYGGDSVETYNYVNSASNTTASYFFENIAGCFGVTDCKTPVFPDQRQIASDHTVGAASLIELPLMGEVAKNAPIDHPFTCGFPLQLIGPQDQFDQYDSSCGNGQLNHVAINPGTPSQDGKVIDSAWDGAEVAHDVSLFGTAAAGGVKFYEPGNEPALWNSTHADMHFAPETNSELISKFTLAAAAVKAADPSAKVIGPSEWGWDAYYCDAASFNGSTCHPPQGASDGFGGTAVAAFLDAMRPTGNLDDFDLHYYPAGGGTDLNITRSLWDPTYTDPSYIDRKIELIPRMKQWVADHDPGLPISLSEYNMDLGGTDHTADTLLEADALGIFAREGLDLATEWGPPTAADPEANAFRLYRDYDGAGARFGNVYVASTSSDQSQLAIYASHTPTGLVTAAVINKTAGALTTPITVAGLTLLSPASVWQATGPTFGFTHAPDVAVAGGATAAITFPAKSMTMVAIPYALPHAPPDDPGSPGTGAPGTGAPGTGTAVPGTGGPGASTGSTKKRVRCTVPKLTGLMTTAARRTLKAHHCALGKVHRLHSSHRRGRIVRQSPKARTTHGAGTPVAVWVSLGRARRSSPR